LDKFLLKPKTQSKSVFEFPSQESKPSQSANLKNRYPLPTGGSGSGKSTLIVIDEEKEVVVAPILKESKVSEPDSMEAFDTSSRISRYYPCINFLLQSELFAPFLALLGILERY
jgi:hypothetical protein